MKVALVLTGHMRCWQTVLPHFRRQFVDVFSPDIFIHTWSDEGWWTAKDASGVHSAAPPVDEAAVRSAYQPKDIVIERYADLEPIFIAREETIADRKHRPRNIISMFYKIHAGMALLEHHMAKTGATYDLVIRTRADLILQAPLPTFNPAKFYTTKDTCGFHGNGGTGDVIHVGHPDTMFAFSKIALDLPGLAERTGGFCPHVMTERYIREIGLPWESFNIRKTLQNTPKGQYGVV